MANRIILLLTLALMYENVNAAPQGMTEPPQVAAGENPLERATDISQGREYAGVGGKTKAPARANPEIPAVAAPFTLSHPICQTGFWIKQRVDERDRNGAIIKSRWVFGCAKGKIIYGGKV